LGPGGKNEKGWGAEWLFLFVKGRKPVETAIILGQRRGEFSVACTANHRKNNGAVVGILGGTMQNGSERVLGAKRNPGTQQLELGDIRWGEGEGKKKKKPAGDHR